MARFLGRRRSFFVKNLPRYSSANLRFKNRNRRGEFVDGFEGLGRECAVKLFLCNFFSIFYSLF